MVMLIGGSCVFVFGPGMSATSQARSRSNPPNPIQQENALVGSDGWLHAEPTGRAIEGYASEVSVQPGDTVHFHVSTTPAEGYHIDVFRLGWYGGLGARLVACLPTCSSDDSGRSYDVPVPDVNGEVDAGWPVTDQLVVPSGWVSGYYLVDYVLTSGPQAGRSAIGYVIARDPPSRQSAVLVQVPVDTWQAYNAWGGRSLYDDQSIGGRRATYVSFERPYLCEPQPGGMPLEWEYPLVRFLEREGYDVSYQTDVDTHANPDSLLPHRLVITAGHGEYWSKTTRDAFDAARDKGVNLAFMGANTGYWQIRYADDTHTIVAYKSTYDPEPDPALKTTMFRALVPPRYECELLGVQFQANRLDFPPSDYTVQPGAIGDPWFAGTGFNAGDVVKGVVSVETDTIPGSQTADSSCGHKLTVFFHLDRGGDQAGNADAYSPETNTLVVSDARTYDEQGAISHFEAVTAFAIGPGCSLPNAPTWTAPDIGQGPKAPALIVGGVAFVVGGFIRGVFALDLTTGALLWSQSFTADVLAPPAFGDGQVYVGDASGALSAIGVGPTPPPAPQPPPSTVELTAGRVTFTQPRAGKPFNASMAVRSGARPVRGRVACAGRVAGKTLRATRRASGANGKATCTWNIPAGSQGKRFKGSITETYKGSKVSRAFSARVK